MDQFKITMQEYLAIVWADSRLQFEVKTGLMKKYNYQVRTVLKIIEAFLERAKYHIEDEKESK